MLTQKQIDAAVQSDLTRHNDIATAWKRYEGDWPASLKPVPSDVRGEDNQIVNLAKVAIDTLAHYLLGQGLEIETDKEEEGADGTSPKDEALDGFWEQNNKEELLLDLAVSGGVSGDAYVLLSAPDGAEGETYPRLTLLDPQHVSVITNPLDYRRVQAYIVCAQAKSDGFVSPVSDGTVIHQQIIERDDAGNWIISERVKEPYRNVFQVSREPVVWPYAWCPLVHCKNLPQPHSFYGVADLSRDMQRANHALNFSISNANRVQRLHGHPKTWAKDVGSDATIDLSPDTVTILEGEGAQLAQLAPASDMASHIEYSRFLRELFHQVSSVPEVASGRIDNLGQLSGLALKILYGPLIRVVTTKQSLYGALIKSVSRLALEMAGFDPKTDIKLHWPDIVPSDEEAALRVATAKQALGVSKSTLVSELGYDAEEEAAKVEAEMPQLVPPATAAVPDALQ